uniref:Uncharacterized protein n=1 Tax=Acrobeloides nanus TaxID=290746 RepID=A0A914DL45_9BILA
IPSTLTYEEQNSGYDLSAIEMAHEANEEVLF